MGLVLNTGNCELIAHRDCVVDDQMLQSFIRVDVGDASLLGAPLFTGTELDNAWLARCDDLARAADRLRRINAQDALILLKSSFSDPTVLHLLRCSSSVSHQSLQVFDAVQRSTIQSITNADLSDVQWLQATLPVKDGGLV